MKWKSPLIGLALLPLLYSVASVAGDIEELSAMLDEFLAHAGEAPAHQRFWAEDLVYTSSAGTRSNKAQILASFDGPASAEERASGPEYRAEDVDIRLYGATAVVAFRLVAASTDEHGANTEQQYFNTGTFLKREGRWKAVAWQATKIPAPE